MRSRFHRLEKRFLVDVHACFKKGNVQRGLLDIITLCKDVRPVVTGARGRKIAVVQLERPNQSVRRRFAGRVVLKEAGDNGNVWTTQNTRQQK